MIFGKGEAGDDPLALMQQRRFKEAVKLLRLRLKRNPSDLALKMRLAEALEGEGRREEAAGIYKEEAEASLSGGERSQGLALLKKAARLLPRDEALAARLAHLERSPEPSARESFSFDLDASNAEAQEAERGAAPRGTVPEPSHEEAPPPEDFRPLLRAYFPELEPGQVDILHGLARPRRLLPGEVLVREEEEGDSLFIVTRGRLEARGRFEAGEMNLGTLAAGDILGEVAFLNRVRRTATVSAVEPSLVLELPGEAARGQLEGHPAVLEHLESVLQERVERTLAVLRAHAKRPHGHP